MKQKIINKTLTGHNIEKQLAILAGKPHIWTNLVHKKKEKGRKTHFGM